MRRYAAFAVLLGGCATHEIAQPPHLSPIAPAAIAAAQTAVPPAEPITARPLPAVASEPEPGATGSLWRSGPQSLFGDRRAQLLGDILTVVVEIDDQAEFRNSSDRSRTGSEAMSAPNLLGLEASAGRLLPNGVGLDPGINTNSSSASNGAGTTRRNEQLTLRIAATVVEVLPNGHLVVAGSQEVRVNFELRELEVLGVVRPEDISRRNEITYDKIASARISYGGRGQITDVQQPRWGQQLLDRALPF